MRQLFLFTLLVLITLVLWSPLYVKAQDTVGFYCSDVYIQGADPDWVGCIYEEDGFCNYDNELISYYRDECVYADRQDTCETYVINDLHRDWPMNQAILCRTDLISPDYYCCPVDEDALVPDQGTDLTDRLHCAPQLNDLWQTMIQEDNVDDALTVGDCEYIEDWDPYQGNVNLCDSEHICDLDTNKYYCCGGYVPPGEKPPIKTNPTDSFRGCQDIEDPVEKQRCSNCVGERDNPTGAVWTELGCIDPSPSGLITRIFQIGLGIMGGIAILRFIQIAILYQSGDAQKIQDARDAVVSLIAGIILLSLGVVILQFLGVNILGLPEGFLGA